MGKFDALIQFRLICELAETKMATRARQPGVVNGLLYFRRFKICQRSEADLRISFGIAHLGDLVTHVGHDLQRTWKVLAEHFPDRKCLKTDGHSFGFRESEEVLMLCKGESAEGQGTANEEGAAGGHRSVFDDVDSI